MTKDFIVATVSCNRNSFGLRGMILVARDSEAWEVGANDLNVKHEGDVIHVPVVNKRGRDFSAFGFEIPTRLPDLPPDVAEEVWNLLTTTEKS